jgi:hypothetical protein
VAHRLFSYGTLQLAAVQAELFGRSVPTTPADLPGFRLDWLTITDPHVVATSGSNRHPILRPDADGAVDGAVLELDDRELARSDAYEVADYARVEVTLGDGRPAWVYVAADSP